MGGTPSPGTRWRISTFTAGLLVAAVSLVGAPPAQADASYAQTVTLPVPPASAFAGNSGGDGWDVSLTADRVYNVYHHGADIRLACQVQADASKCHASYPKTITDEAGNGFYSGYHSATELVASTGHLFTYGVRRNSQTAGVVCIDTTLPDTDDPFCGFTPLLPDGSIVGSNGSGWSGPARVGTKWYAVSSSGSSRGDIMCFDLATTAACPGQPFAAGFTVGSQAFSTAAVAGRLFIPNGSQIGCFDTATLVACSGNWPVSVGSTYHGAPFPYLDPSGTPLGICFPNGGDPCFDFLAGALPTPPGMPAAIEASQYWNGPAVVLGTRVYVPSGSNDRVGCWDYATSASCPGFPLQLSPKYLYTVNQDPHRPTCLWVNGDNGNRQVETFDAYGGGPCGQGAIRVLAAQFVVDDEDCFPSDYSALRLTSPAPSTYTSATVEFLTGSGNPTGIPDQPFDATGTVDLTGLGLEAQPALPQFLITLNDAPADLGEVVLRLEWSADYDPACNGPDTEVDPAPTSTTLTVTGGGSTGTDVTVLEGQAATANAVLGGDNAASAGGTVTYTWYTDIGCTHVASQGSPQAVTTPGQLPESAPVMLPVGSYLPVVTYGGDPGNEPSSSACSGAVLTVRSPNEPPVVAAATSDVTTPEGTDASMTGTASDPDGDTVTLSADVPGLVDHGDGTWTWSAPAPDGPSGPVTVTVTADDGNGETATAVFAVSVTNVAPTVDAGPDRAILFGGSAALDGAFTDPGADADWTVDISWGDGATTSYAAGTTGPISDEHQYLTLGEHEVTVCVTDDVEQRCDTATVVVANGNVGKVTGGVSTVDGAGKGGLNVQAKQGGIQGNLQFEDDSTSFHSSDLHALAVSPSGTSAWFAGTGKDGRGFVAHVEDNGEPGRTDRFRLWIDGVLHAGDGALSSGNIQIHTT